MMPSSDMLTVMGSRAFSTWDCTLPKKLSGVSPSAARTLTVFPPAKKVMSRPSMMFSLMAVSPSMKARVGTWVTLTT